MTRTPADERFADLAALSHVTLLRRIQRLLGPTLAARVEAQDILQQTFVTALPHFRAKQVDAPEEFARWILQFALNVIRATARRHRSEPPTSGPDVAEPSRAEPDAVLYEHRGLQARGKTVSLEGQRVLALREAFDAPWATIAFLLERPDSAATRRLLERARKTSPRARDAETR